MVSGVLLVLLVLQARVVLMELQGLSDQRVMLVLPDPRVGLDHKAHLDRRAILETVVLRVNVEMSVLLVLPALLASAVLLVLPVQLAKVVTSSGTRR